MTSQMSSLYSDMQKRAWFTLCDKTHIRAMNKTGWCAFEDFAQLLLIYLFYCRFRWMINNNALESSNEFNRYERNRYKVWTLRAQPLRSNSLLGLSSRTATFFRTKRSFYTRSSHPPIHNCRSSPIRTWHPKPIERDV